LTDWCHVIQSYATKLFSYTIITSSLARVSRELISKQTAVLYAHLRNF
jgi:hypothetical protein